MSTMIDVKDLVLVYSNGTRAVDNISFNVKKGEFFGFLGPNGAGKSTTIKVLTTLLKKTSGSVHVSGYNMDKDSKEIRKMIGVQSQDTAVDGDLTGRENLMLQGHFQQIPTKILKQRVDELLKLVDLEKFADKRARNYSGGMKKRLDLATTLVHRPQLLFLDEPTTGLDPQSRSAIWEYLEKLNKEDKTTIFLTTQYMEEADRLCRTLAIIDTGKIVASGSPTELKQQLGVDSIKITLKDYTKDKTTAVKILKSLTGVSNITESDECLTVFAKNASQLIADIVRALDSLEIGLAGISFSSPTLDDVYLQKTGKRIRTEELGKTPSTTFMGRKR
ncbi:MAG: ATP-binding cassette domain-containing protein [Candidatus Bathyarchaeota archaeon]|nr:ATP-binding cassette domain-containing protein [Candidatus Bathyarchaeum tardum]WGM89487.1 MAG: ATP-binding cassette domain-containing protein [Candidatus Bathyarchaeum tardum]WNZ28239.1 MAG: ATP-binding cassette domain-containing protein [Candidatus Bathyarchaeota archaeon]